MDRAGTNSGQFVSEEEVKALGFRGLRQAKACFYKRAKVCPTPWLIEPVSDTR